MNDPSTAGYRLRTATGRNMATCLVLVSERKIKELKLPKIAIDVAYRTRPPYLGNHYDYEGHPAFAKADPATQPGLVLAAAEVYRRAGVEPSDIQLAQVHDLSAFEGMESLEGMGIVPEGQGGRFAMEGGTALTGRCPTNTDGGALSYGHSSAGGDFGSKIHENWLQLTGKAGERQVKGARIAAAQAYGSHHSMEVCSVMRNLEEARS
ncbi:MAG: hypothetical protein JNG85_08330 [Spirochaetaceae bacterium]|nr:hypothetical protein [Spirochaetaceae bacterium]